MARPQVADEEEGLQIWRVAANILNKQSRIADKGWPSSLEIGRGLTTPHHKKVARYEMLQRASELIKARRMRWAGHVARMGEVRGAYILVGKPEGRGPLGRPRRRWEDNIKMDLREIGFGDVNWIHWAQDRDRWRALVNTVMNLRVP
jgi:hypothetical protein